jgi:hypothetical protein
MTSRTSKEWTGSYQLHANTFTKEENVLVEEPQGLDMTKQTGLVDVMQDMSPAQTQPLSTSTYRSRTLSYTFKVQLTDRNADCPPVMTEYLAAHLRDHCPPRLKLARAWKLVYALDQHGISRSTMFRCCKDAGALVLAVMDVNGNVFGSFLNQELSPHIGYYGSGECFLWKAEGDGISAYPWSGKNTYCILSEGEFLAFGGGSGKFGLWLDGEFDRGHSDTCDTFDNAPLAGTSAGEFECDRLELWGFQL